MKYRPNQHDDLTVSRFESLELYISLIEGHRPAIMLNLSAHTSSEQLSNYNLRYINKDIVSVIDVLIKKYKVLLA